MAYIDADYYTNVYQGIGVGDEPTLLRLINKASEKIDQITGFKIAQRPNKLDDFTPFIQEQVKKAVATQVDFFVLNGEHSANTSGELSNVSIGRFSYTDSSKSAGNSSSGQNSTSPEVISHLIYTGLLYMGIGVCHG
ncbi:hypothetical protein COJ09_23530 [Bacillus thuringiensis]|uniref:hypothetical protein n=1 Tax=Bacillus thuringiensis TaxID=1428 RepID=UPI000BF354E3|nr:hypothetical protein [Bacillus thuringiensis]PFK54913.1 hypothetical protein COJ09_23530 [Bacillus thuringiensis]PGR79467.1 hypothetical protein COC43_07835 [Bacillus thuringiensis]